MAENSSFWPQKRQKIGVAPLWNFILKNGWEPSPGKNSWLRPYVSSNLLSHSVRLFVNFEWLHACMYTTGHNRDKLGPLFSSLWFPSLLIWYDMGTENGLHAEKVNYVWLQLIPISGEGQPTIHVYTGRAHTVSISVQRELEYKHQHPILSASTSQLTADYLRTSVYDPYNLTEAAARQSSEPSTKTNKLQRPKLKNVLTKCVCNLLTMSALGAFTVAHS